MQEIGGLISLIESLPNQISPFPYFKMKYLLVEIWYFAFSGQAFDLMLQDLRHTNKISARFDEFDMSILSSKITCNYSVLRTRIPKI